MSYADHDADRLYEDDEQGGDPGEVKCKHCGAYPLTWLHTGVRWRLVDEKNRFHVCVEFSKNDFDKL